MTDGKLADEEVIKDVPDSELQETIELCERDGGRAIPERQTDGNWQVTCIYNDADKPSS